jgi:hypothetical protein
VYARQDDLLVVVYWIRQILAMVAGLLFGAIPLTGAFGLLLFGICNAVIVYVYCNTYLGVDGEEMGQYDLLSEGFMNSFAFFLVRRHCCRSRLVLSRSSVCTRRITSIYKCTLSVFVLVDDGHGLYPSRCFGSRPTRFGSSKHCLPVLAVALASVRRRHVNFHHCSSRAYIQRILVFDCPHTFARVPCRGRSDLTEISVLIMTCIEGKLR